LNKIKGFIVEDGIFGGLLLLILGVPLICSPFIQNHIFLIKTVFFQSLVFALFILWLSKKFLARESVSHIPLKVPMFLFLSIGFLSLVLSPYRYVVLEEFLRFLSFFVLYVLIVEEVTDHTRKTLVIDFLTIITLIVAIYGVLQHLGYNLFDWVPADTQRIASFFGNPNFFATYLVATLPLLLVRSLKSTTKRKFLAGITLGLALACLIFTATRSAWIGFGFSFLFLVFLIHATKVVRLNFKVLFPLFMVFSAIFLIIILNQNMIIGRISAMWPPSGSAFQRLHIWEVTISMIKASPIFGTGLGTFQIVFPKFRYPDFNLDVPIGNLLHAHNEYLEIWSEMGLIGLGVFLWLMISFLHYAFKMLKNEKEKGLLVAGLVSGIVGVLIDSLFSVSLRWTGSAFIFWFLFGLTIAMIRPKALSTKEKGGKSRGKLTHLVVISGAFICIMLITRWHIEKYEANIYVARAQTFLDSGRKSNAMLEFKKALNKDPDCLLALYLMGSLNVEEEDFDEAKTYFEKLERLAPDFANIHEWKGYLLFQLRDIPAAEAEYKICTKTKSKVFNYKMLGRIYALQNKWDSAIDAFEKACQLGAEAMKSPVDTSIIHSAEDKMERSIQTAHTGNGRDSRSFERDEIINAHLLLAKAYYEKEEYDKSIQQVEKVTSQALSEILINTIAQLYNNIAWNYAKKGENLDQALELCQRALSLKSLHPELIYDTRAWVYFKKGRFKKAKKELEKAIQIAPENEIFKQHLTIIQEAIRGKLKDIDMQKIR
jgi:tetratricopeptide (TPR) repeat protein